MFKNCYLVDLLTPVLHVYITDFNKSLENIVYKQTSIGAVYRVLNLQDVALLSMKQPST